MSSVAISDLGEYIKEVELRRRSWTPELLSTIPNFPTGRTDYEEMAHLMWFRGHACEEWELKPRLFRDAGYDPRSEIELNMECRNRARALAGVPPQGDYPAWLCFMQHHGLPTRLLDWTESSTAALFFALEEWASFKHKWERWEWFSPRVWMMNPHAMNWVGGTGSSQVPGTALDERWGNDKDGWTVALGAANIFPAFGAAPLGIPEKERPYPTQNPMAVKPQYLHARMQVQQSRFTVHSIVTDSIQDIFKDSELTKRGFLASIEIERDTAEHLLIQLEGIGVSRSTLFPDIEGVTSELAARFARRLASRAESIPSSIDRSRGEE